MQQYESLRFYKKSSMHLKEKVNLRTDLVVDHLFIFVILMVY